jgi:hypothetical protein
MCQSFVPRNHLRISTILLSWKQASADVRGACNSAQNH